MSIVKVTAPDFHACLRAQRAYRLQYGHVFIYESLKRTNVKIESLRTRCKDVFLLKISGACKTEYYEKWITKHRDLESSKLPLLLLKVYEASCTRIHRF